MMVVPEDELAALTNLGYVDRAKTRNPQRQGVTVERDDGRSGLNLYGSRDRADAFLMDMAGEVVHRWTSGRPEAWMHMEPLDDGSLLAITKDVGVAKYDFDSERLWETHLRAHHDLAVRDDGHILVLTGARTAVVYGGETLPVLCDGVTVLSPDGEVVSTHPLLPLLRDSLSDQRLSLIRTRLDEGRTERELLREGGVGDVLHTNSIQILHRDIEGVAPAGSVLLSFRTISRVAIVTRDLSELLWIWGRGELDGQHDATQLEDGHLLIFDNGLKRNRDSRVIEVDATKGEVVWTFAHPELFTRLRGGAQALRNDNILITESDSGHALEITRDGELVWEFWNPDVRGEERATIYRLNRFPRAYFPALAETPDGR
jgi:hypothetical protein